MDYVARLVYDCTFEGNAEPLSNMPPKTRYFNKLPDFYCLKSC